MAEDDSSHSDLRQVVERLESLEHVLRMHTERLYELERRLDIDFRPAPVARDAPPRTTRDEGHAPTPPSQPSAPNAFDARPRAQTDARANTHSHAQEDAQPHTSQPPFTQTPPDSSRDAGRVFGAAADAERGRTRDGRGTPFGASPYSARGAEPTTTKKRVRDVESMVGGSWFNWLGIIAITFGVAFFLKYAFDNEWIGPAARVSLGAAAGVAILAVAERLRARGLRQYAYVLSGGGVLILYLSTYAAYAFYGMVGQAPAFVLMSAVTALAVALSVRHDALAVAVLGLVGGFVTPVLLSTGRDNQAALFTYIALLDAGLLAVAYFKSWRILNFLSFFATAAMFVGWMGTHYSAAKLWPTVFFLSLFFVLFSALAPVHNVLRKRPARWHDVLLVVVNATFYFALAYALLDAAGYGDGLGSFALIVSTFFVLLFYFAWSRQRGDRLLVYSYAGAAVTFFTMAVAIQLDQHWVTIAWATEGLMLVWVGLRAREAAARHAALAVFAVALMHWFSWDMRDFAFREGAEFIPLLNRRALSCAALVFAFVACAWLYRRAGEGVEEEERRSIGNFFVLAASALGLTLLTLDLSDYFTQRLAREAADDSERRAMVENARQFSLTALWTFYGAAAFALGFRRGSKTVRYGALVLLTATAIKLLAVDITFYAAPWHAPVFNQTFTAFALLVAALALVIGLYSRARGFDEGELSALPVLIVAANLLAIVALSAEASGHFGGIIRQGGLAPDDLRDLRLAEGLSLSVIWALYGGGMLAYGHARRNKLLRLTALALLGLTTLKVFFWDLAALDRVYRIISFIVLGAILLAVSYFYQKKQQRAAVAEGTQEG